MLNISGITLTFNRPSEINGAPIGTLLQVGSNNQKTGYSLQTVYFPTAKPTLAITTGSDAAVCGDCKCRPIVGGWCYLNHMQLNQQYQKFMRGGYPRWDELSKFERRHVNRLREVFISRLGKWGDPASDKSVIPFMTEYGRCLGYTHQWDKPQHQDLQPVCMASVDDPLEYGRANDMGWRTFRTKLESDPLLPNEIICPYPKVQCVDCGMCDGKDSRFRKNIAVNAHGVRYKVSRYKEYRTQLELPVV